MAGLAGAGGDRYVDDRLILAGQQRILGGKHPQTLTFQNNLAGAYQAAGDLGRAIPLFEQTHIGLTRIMGCDHRQTIEVRANLAAARQQHERGTRGC